MRNLDEKLKEILVCYEMGREYKPKGKHTNAYEKLVRALAEVRVEKFIEQKEIRFEKPKPIKL